MIWVGSYSIGRGVTIFVCAENIVSCWSTNILLSLLEICLIFINKYHTFFVRNSFNFESHLAARKEVCGLLSHHRQHCSLNLKRKWFLMFFILMISKEGKNILMPAKLFCNNLGLILVSLFNSYRSTSARCVRCTYHYLFVGLVDTYGTCQGFWIKIGKMHR